MGDTWVYDLSARTWTDKAPAAAPSARYHHAMACVCGDQVLLFGGDDGAFDGETWVYDFSFNTRKNRAPAAAPPARSWYSMAALDGGDVPLSWGGGMLFATARRGSLAGTLPTRST